MTVDKFETILNDNEQRIYNYIMQFVKNEDDAQDLVQVTFISFYEHLDEIKPDTAIAYLYRIAHNKSVSLIKKRNKVISHDPQDFINIPEITHQANDYDATTITEAIRELPQKLSTIIHLQYYSGLSYKEMSEQLGISVKAVESLLVRAKKILRKKLCRIRR